MCSRGDLLESLLERIGLLVQRRLLPVDLALLILEVVEAPAPLGLPEILVLMDAFLLCEDTAQLLLQSLALSRDGSQLVQERLLLLGPPLCAAAVAVVCRSAARAAVLCPEVRQTLATRELLEAVAQLLRPGGDGRLVARQTRGPECAEATEAAAVLV
jgi:hypothetical protein